MGCLENLKKYNIILGSQSPRRKELLAGLDIPFTVNVASGLEEKYPETLRGPEIPLFLAELKANAQLPKLTERDLLITADTIVWHNGKVFGKPQNMEQARDMLRQLSGHTHEVFTGVCISTKNKRKSFSSVSRVTFSHLTEDEISYYLSKYAPLDKAGAYGVQEWIGYVTVEHIDGSYFNVMGLPIQRLYTELKNF